MLIIISSSRNIEVTLPTAVELLYPGIFQHFGAEEFKAKSVNISMPSLKHSVVPVNNLRTGVVRHHAAGGGWF